MVGDRSGSFQGVFLEYRAGWAHALFRHVKIGAGSFTRRTVYPRDVFCLKRLHFQGTSDAFHLVPDALARGLNRAFAAKAHIDVFPGKRNSKRMFNSHRFPPNLLSGSIIVRHFPNIKRESVKNRSC